MPVIPSGILALPLEHLRNTIAGSVTFQGLVGAANEESAKEKIYLGTVKEDEDHKPTRCQLRLDDGEVAERTGTTSWRGAGPIEMLFVLNRPEGVTDPQDEYTTILNQLGAIVREMMTIVTSEPWKGLAITGIRRRYVGQWDEDMGGDNLWEAEFSVQWEGM